MATTRTAENTQSAAKSKPTALPAVSQTASGQSGSEPGTELEHELPGASEIAAHLRMEPATATADDEEADDLDAEQPDTPALADEPAAEVEATEDSDESATAEEASDGSADDAGESTPDASTEAEDDASAEPEAAEPAPAKSRSQSRIDELTARAKSAEERAAALEESLAAAKHTARDHGPLATVDALDDLKRVEENELAWHKWALRNEGSLDGADVADGKGGTRHYEPDEIREIKAATFESLYSHIPSRREYLAQRQTHEQAAETAYPWLRKTTEGDGADVQKLIVARPYLRQAPDYRLLAADAVVGAKLRQAGITVDAKLLAQLGRGRVKPAAAPAPAEAGARPTAKPAPVPVRRTAPSPARPGTLPPRTSGREAAARLAEKRLNSSDGNVDAVAGTIAAKLRW